MAQAATIINPTSRNTQAHSGVFGMRLPSGDVAAVEDKLPNAGELGIFWFKSAEQPAIARLCTEIESFPFDPSIPGVPLILLEERDTGTRYAFSLDELARVARVRKVFTKTEVDSHAKEPAHA